MSQQMWHQMSSQDVTLLQQTNAEQGLSDEEARLRLERSGANELSEGVKLSRSFSY